MTKAITTLLASSALALCSPALAQSAAPEQKPDDKGVGDIIVTANRIATSAQDTPIALNAYNGQQLAQSGINSVRDLSSIDPSLNVSSSNSSAYVAVRGIASTDVTELGDPSVPVSRDGFFTNRAYSINTSMYDVARVEVLKGPQGTLQGRNSTGGLVSIITNRPKFKTEFSGAFEYGRFNTTNAEAMANIALSDSFAIRASGVLLKHDGYRPLTGVMKSADNEDFKSGRVQARFAKDGFDLWVSYQRDDRNTDGEAVLKNTLGAPQPSFDKLAPFSSSSPQSTVLKGERVRWEASYSGLGKLNLIYSGGWDKQDFRLALDATGPNYPANRQYLNTQAPTTWNHEVRINNQKTGKLFVQAGWFHFSEDNALTAGLFNREMTGLFGPGGPLSFAPNANQSFRYGIKFDFAIKTRSDAVFAQAEYDLTEQLQLSVGGRYTWDNKSRTGNSVLVLPALAFPLCANSFPTDPTACPPFPITNSGNGSTKEKRPTWHLGLNYRPAPGRLIYAKYDRGYKAGGFNSNGSVAATPYDAESVDAFEIGTKNSLMDNALQLNFAAFYFNYKGYQAQQSTCPTCSTGVFNVGSARVLGLEGQANARIGANTRLYLNTTLLDTRFGNNIIVTNGNNQNVNISRNQLPNAPHFTASLGLEQTVPLSDYELSFRADGKYSSSFYFSAFNLPQIQSKAYFLGNLSASIAPSKGPWKLQAYVRNVFNKNVLSFAEQNFNGFSDNYQFQQPRTYGIRASVNF
ncbi:TonB-dependent receptor [Novosphingobium flavum]|uniref:TonB-dependent receptor domain-containing protein n=1 Tax=Novosphingobium aerophilum TaxID=2839843 RepID=UPI0016398E60|nr:TonB-dependent receptor [Novosphingobium aerophilum]